MKEVARRITLGAVMTTAATLLGMWVMLDPWASIGWETPNQHKVSIDKLVAEYKLTSGEIKNFRDEWKCDEYYEELLDLKRELRAAESNDRDTVEIEHEIELLQDKIQSLKCTRFEDFG